MRRKNRLLNKQLIVFTHWTRKNYAVFNSLKRTIKIGVLVSPLGMLVQPAYCQMQPDSLSLHLQIQDVEVSAENAAFVYSQQSRIVTIIPKSEIERVPAKNLEEVIEMATGLDLRSRGSGVQSDLSFRGGSFEQTQILIDGINVSDPQSGHYSLNLPLDLGSIDRIEILHGSGARIFGTNAYAATINVITAKPKETAISIRGRVGEHRLYEAGLAASLKGDKINHGIHTEFTGSDGYHPNSDHQMKTLTYRANYNKNRFRINGLASIQDKSFGSNKFYSAKYEEQFDHNQSGFINLTADYISKSSRSAHSAAVYYRIHNDHYILIRSNPGAYQNYHLNQTQGFKYKWKTDYRLGITSVGAEYRAESILSTNLGLSSDSIPVPWKDSAWFTKSDQRNHLSIFIDHSLNKRNFTLSFGGLVHYLPGINKLAFYPGIDMSLKTKLGDFMASASQTMRLPSFTELYYQAPDLIGNQLLLPEKAISLEMSYRMNIQSLTTQLTYFQRIGSELIDWIWLDQIQKWQTVNLSKITFYGIEAGMSWKPTGFKYLDELKVNYVGMKSSKIQLNVETRYVNDYLKHQLGIKLFHTIYRGLGLSWQAQWQDRVGKFQLYDPFTGTFNLFAYQPQLRIDLRLFFKRSNYEIVLDMRNLTNDHHYDLGSVPQPGRWISAGINWKII
jgi:vitamin B12 transporter